MVGISVSLGDFQLACANCYSLENTKLVRNLFVGVKRNKSATYALDTNWLVYFLGKLMYMALEAMEHVGILCLTNI